MLDIELVLEAGAAATFDRDTQHGAVAFLPEDFPDPAGGSLADGDGSGHGKLPGKVPVNGVIPNSFGIPHLP